MATYTFTGTAIDTDDVDSGYASGTPTRYPVHGTVTASSPYQARVKAEAAVRAKGLAAGDIDVTLA
ncbi:hypothetical protein [Streptomyces sp. NPDC015680]|uniref:hypothetical protein n=1 Tax=Streptomyces sp. NPDC015680 TaxID=3364962 RepID=UPI00370335B3